MAEQLFLAVVVGSAFVYARGLTRLWQIAGARRIVTPLQALSFAAAFAVLLIALEPPLESAVAANLPAHMVQHVLLLAVVPPLFAAAAPLTVAMYALPGRARRRVQPAWRGLLRSQEHRYWLAWTAGAFALANLTLAVWHVPALYDAAVRNDGVHVLEHVSFVATATLFWWMVLGAGRRERRGLGVLGVFVATLPATALGVLMTLAATSWYAPYGNGSTAVRNQQVAGAVMWGFGGLALVVAAAALFAGWLAAMDRADARARGAGRNDCGPDMIKRIGRWFDDRLGASRFARTSLNKVFPDHWSFMLGEVAMYCFLVLVLTGVYLTFFFVPSDQAVVYTGSYGPLRGTTMSQAYESTVRLSFDVRAGLVMRQIHHWAALLFIATIVAHLCRIFFTGAFRRPRELNWIIGVTLLVLAIFNGFAGYSLPDDLLSGTGLRIAYSIALAIPLAGTWLAFLVFGGEFPANDILTRLFVIHILIIPVAIATLLGAHLAIVWRQKHTHFRGRGRREDNVVGSRLWPTYAAKSIGLFALVAGVLALLGGLAQINPVWLYGPFDPSAVSTAAQPDWYMGWIEGALRLAPPAYLKVGAYNISEIFWPAIALPGVTFGLLYLWPFLERRVTHDTAEHHLLDRPSDRPMRTALGVAVLTFYAVLLLAGAQDIWAQKLDISLSAILWTFRILLLALPLLFGWLTWKICRDLRAGHHSEHQGELAELPVASNETTTSA